MKPNILLFIALLAVCALALPGCSKSGAASANAATVDLSNTTELNYTITGMHCDACAEAIAGKVKQVPGVVTCDASFEKHSLEVKTADPAADEAIRTAVTDLGYGIEPASDAPSGETDGSPGSAEQTS